ncbi:hypothetical protein MNBD_GAMMA08-2028 [hydrothermal vent metagenome]|uniref:Outer membrane protein beta-barrel domain-containing protein n=1 Tax=hydrothermal vent metagenome TaxID=652676 RepID=A0A3B0X6Y7_9ZZZZ
MKFRFIVLILCSLVVLPASATNFYIGVNAGLMNQSGTFNVIDGELDPTVGLDRPKDYFLEESDDLTYSGYVGYKLGSDLFIEVGYAKNSEVKGETRRLSSFPPEAERGAFEDYETNYVYTSFVGIWPMGKRWAISTRLGFSVWNIDYTQSSSDIPASGELPTREQIESGEVPVNNILITKLSDNTSALLLGLGISYALNRNIEFKLAVENHFLDFSFTNVELDYTSLSYTLGVAYHF